ncbi:MAG: hypothetical protein U0930_05650 [Pirellulales bacterium]
MNLSKRTSQPCPNWADCQVVTFPMASWFESLAATALNALNLCRLAGSMNGYQASLNQLPAGSYRVVLTTPFPLESTTAANFVVLAPPESA